MRDAEPHPSIPPWRLPAVAPAVAALAGALLALHLPITPRLTTLVALGTLATLPSLMALRYPGRVSRAGLWTTRGILLGTAGGAAVLVHSLVPAARGVPDAARPVVAVLKPGTPWIADDDGWSTQARVVSLEQAGEAVPFRQPVQLHLPNPELKPPAGTLEVRGYLRRSSGAWNRSPTPPGPWRLWLSSRLLVEVCRPPGLWSRLSHRLRSRVDAQLDAAGVGQSSASGSPPGPGTALARALVLGDRQAVPLRTHRLLRRWGLSHLLAVSGLHLGLLLAAVLLPTSLLPARIRGLRWIPVVGAVGVYLLLVGPRPSLLRASSMALLAVAALVLHRAPQAVQALALVLLGVVFLAPAWLLDLGFQLSAAATGGLLVLGPALGRGLEAVVRAPRPSPMAAACQALGASCGAWAASLPWAVGTFHWVAPVAPLANLVAVPWAGLFLSAALLWTGTATVSPETAVRATPVLDALAAPLTWLEGVSPAAWQGHPVVRGAADDLGDGQARLTMLDVGQGEALLLQGGPGPLLVDGGGWRRGDFAGRVLVPALAGEGVQRLRAVVVTHPDLDHCRGLVGLVDYLPVEEVWTPERWWDSPCLQDLRARPWLRIRTLGAGEAVPWGLWRLTALHPPKLPENRSPATRTNDGSLVLRAEAQGVVFLLTGDIEAGAESQLLRAQGPAALSARVLKLAHHGSKTSTSSAFLAAVAPRLALASAGRHNLYGHPAAEVRRRLREAGVPLLRTDLHGRISLTLDARFPGHPRWQVAAWPPSSARP